MDTSDRGSLLPRSDKYLQLGAVALAAGAVATGINLLIARIATPLVNAPTDYPSFTWLPLLTGCMVGAIGAAISYILLRRWSTRPGRAFLILSTVVLMASYGLPVLPIMNPLPRFAGVNWGIAVTLMGMHTLTAILIVSAILLWQARFAD